MGKTQRLGWLLLLYQLPTRSSNLRVKIWRRLQKLGAINLKSSAYLLPYNETSEEDFQWLCQEIIDGGGDAILLLAYGLSDEEEEEIVRLFQEARAKDYEGFIEECNRRIEEFERAVQGDPVGVMERFKVEERRLRSRLDEIQMIDFFGAPGREEAIIAFRTFSDALRRAGEVPVTELSREHKPLNRSEYQGKIWLTRSGMHIDRLASAWLIRRFLDPNARFEFVPAGQIPPSSQERIPFDIYGAFFSHRGEDCTFETLLKSFGLTDDPALNTLAQIVHDVDLKDGKFGRSEAAGIDLVIQALREKCEGDEALLEEGLALFDALYEKLRSKE